MGAAPPLNFTPAISNSIGPDAILNTKVTKRESKPPIGKPTTTGNCSLIRVSQKSPSVFALIKFLPCPACNQLDGMGNHVSILSISNQQMDVIGCNGIIENHQPIALFCFIKPLQPPSAFCKFEQKLSLMASVGDVPYLPRNVVPLCSCHA